MRFFVLLGLALVVFFLLRAWFRRGSHTRHRRGPDDWPDPERPLPTLLELDDELAGPDPPAQAGTQPSCPVCEHPAGTTGLPCPDCGAVHHPECWQLNDGCGRCRPIA